MRSPEKEGVGEGGAWDPFPSHTIAIPYDRGLEEQPTSVAGYSGSLPTQTPTLPGQVHHLPPNYIRAPVHYVQ